MKVSICKEEDFNKLLPVKQSDKHKSNPVYDQLFGIVSKNNAKAIVFPEGKETLTSLSSKIYAAMAFRIKHMKLGKTKTARVRKTINKKSLLVWLGAKTK